MMDWLLRKAEDLTVQVADQTLPISIRRHPRATRMTLRLAPDGSEVRLTIPQWGRTAEALEFARRRADWLGAQLANLPDNAPPHPGGAVLYRGHPLTIHWAANAPRKPMRVENALRIGGPESNLPTRLGRWLEGEALQLMEEDLAHYCQLIGRDMQPIRLSRAKRRWGSCSSDGTVRLNWRLIQAPDLVRRSVVAHEVAHLVHFDHSPAFHALLRDIFEGDVAQANQWLKREGRTLYTAFG
ncbi:DUF45 domain-containing protein [Altererythrobacter indicus]|uniref:DUF45 domain-containing protein n=1 Tax=Altericroceibacterium indicum TaxID=374177 RepID=A0A845A6T6_9SPHN|nr:SprT family zinc-dependent metalloprotease [Altericroceibacterium indicum]MXP26082.1 DUF45 domain-containing protein [Altericroceibacterium indicum]